MEDEEGKSYIMDRSEAEQQNELCISYIDDIYITIIPTDKSYEVRAYIPMGVFNECPPTEEQIFLGRINLLENKKY